MTHDEISEMLLSKMPYAVEFRASDLGEMVFGMWKFQIGDCKFPYTRQTLSLMIGKHLRKMEREDKLFNLLTSEKSVWINYNKDN